MIDVLKMLLLYLVKQIFNEEGLLYNCSVSQRIEFTSIRKRHFIDFCSRNFLEIQFQNNEKRSCSTTPNRQEQHGDHRTSGGQVKAEVLPGEFSALLEVCSAKTTWKSGQVSRD